MKNELIKECGVVMLEVESSTIYGKKGNLQWYKIAVFSNAVFKPIHLYITSDDEIKKDEWCYDVELKHIDKFYDSWCELAKANARKIIASTDPSLGLPSPSDKFIKVFIEDYNAGKVIDKVLVEYECPQCQEWGYISECRRDCNQRFLQPKLKDNNIIIKPVKDSWSREEVQVLVKRFISFYKEKHPETEFPLAGVGKWIEQNL